MFQGLLTGQTLKSELTFCIATVSCGHLCQVGAHTVLGTDIPDVLTPLSTRLSKRRRARADVANQVDDAESLA